MCQVGWGGPTTPRVVSAEDRRIITSVTEVIERERVSAGLFEAIGQFRRRVRRRVGSPVDQNGHTRAEEELLRHIRRHPGATVSGSARDLGMAVNTVSTLVARLVQAGSLVRRADPADGRVVRLELSEPVAARIGSWRDARVAVTAAAIAQLSPADQLALAAALPVLVRLTELVDPDGSEISKKDHDDPEEER
nr:MarR family transcriptional regulator [Acidipropionibacterium jensenii]